MTQAETGQSDFERLGGESVLRRIVADFIGRVYADVFIGFHFDGIDQAHIVDREVELAGMHLGGPMRYRGTPIAIAHRKHPINRGHFHRRIYLLEQTLIEHGVDRDIIERWLAHDRRLEPVVTNHKTCLD